MDVKDGQSLPIIDLSNHHTWTRIAVKGDDDDLYILNSVNVSGCDKLWNLGLMNVKLQSVRLHALPTFYALELFQCVTTDLAVESMDNLGSVKCDGCTIQNLTIKGCPVLGSVDCADNNSFYSPIIVITNQSPQS